MAFGAPRASWGIRVGGVGAGGTFENRRAGRRSRGAKWVDFSEVY